MERNLSTPEQKRKESLWFLCSGTWFWLSLLPHTSWTWPVWGHRLSDTCFVKWELEHLFGKGWGGGGCHAKHTGSIVDPAVIRVMFQKWNTTQAAENGIFIPPSWLWIDALRGGHVTQQALATCSAPASHKLSWQLDVWAWVKLPRDSQTQKEEGIWCNHSRRQGGDRSQAFRLLAFSSLLLS